MEEIYNTVVNAIIIDLEEEYEGNKFELLEELECGLKQYNDFLDACRDHKLNFYLSQIIEDCPELYAYHWESLKATLEYYRFAIQSY
ncbi:hypothetical protein GH741_05450 [Aquibacillus halophilus]|uniref:Uncharacterized protein n=1 Tax=Aquibacillus halophilus TaxID=930132 RepID=A0A6A8DA01_9BACI|nr:hypothetical protein [Aquibacillus halophilus]MRH42120.1 hypothetical protein [Aquibacillus halophilus]